MPNKIHPMKRVAFAVIALGVGLLLLLAAWTASWLIPPRASAPGASTLAAIHGPVTIDRDARDIPHIHASSTDDAFFAEGYVVAQDRLFQMDLVRRSVAGELSEVFGKPALGADIKARLIRPRAMARASYEHLSPQSKRDLEAFTAGVNAAMQREPLPPEFRLLGYRPRAWLPEDSILAGLATVLVLTNDWDAILLRERVNQAIGAAASARLNMLSDPVYDVPLAGTIRASPCRPLPPRPQAPALSNALSAELAAAREPAEASNEWAVGAARTTTGRALVANDPHLDFNVPGIWYLVEIEAPGLHVSGAALVGTPGVILGHTSGVAWGATNATVSTVTVYREPRSAVRDAGADTIQVRFGSPVSVHHNVTRHGFVFFADGRFAYSAQWVPDRDPRSPLDTFLALDRAATIEQALAALRTYAGPPQNFVLGDASGRVAFHMAGFVPNDGVWSTRVVDGTRVADAWRGYVPFDALPHVDASRDAIVFTSNNRMVGSSYPYQLTDAWVPAFRAHRVAELLKRAAKVSVDDARRMQLDDLSLADLEFARDLAAFLRRNPATARSNPTLASAIAAWNGRMTPDSTLASLVWQERRDAAKAYAALVLGHALGSLWAKAGDGRATEVLLCALRSHAIDLGKLDVALPSADPLPWRFVGRTPLHHPLHGLGITLFDPPGLPGHGDFASVAVRTATLGQSFRAVWDVGNWSNGGIVIPLGENGLMQTPHATDQEAAYLAGTLFPL